MVLQSNDVQTCFFLKMPNFCTVFLYYVVEMSEKENPNCVGHVLRFSNFDVAPTHHKFREIEVGGRHM